MQAEWKKVPLSDTGIDSIIRYNGITWRVGLFQKGKKTKKKEFPTRIEAYGIEEAKFLELTSEQAPEVEMLVVLKKKRAAS